MALYSQTTDSQVTTSDGGYSVTPPPAPGTGTTSGLSTQDQLPAKPVLPIAIVPVPPPPPPGSMPPPSLPAVVPAVVPPQGCRSCGGPAIVAASRPTQSSGARTPVATMVPAPVTGLGAALEAAPWYVWVLLALVLLSLFRR